MDHIETIDDTSESADMLASSAICMSRTATGSTNFSSLIELDPTLIQARTSDPSSDRDTVGSEFIGNILNMTSISIG